LVYLHLPARDSGRNVAADAKRHETDKTDYFTGYKLTFDKDDKKIDIAIHN